MNIKKIVENIFNEDVDVETSNYRSGQIQKVIDNATRNPEYSPTIQIRHVGVATNYMNISVQEIKELLRILTGN